MWKQRCHFKMKTAFGRFSILPYLRSSNWIIFIVLKTAWLQNNITFHSWITLLWSICLFSKLIATMLLFIRNIVSIYFYHFLEFLEASQHWVPRSNPKDVLHFNIQCKNNFSSILVKLHQRKDGFKGFTCFYLVSCFTR
jgi:hypothetical protein